MTHMRQLSGRDVLRVLGRFGFQVVSTRGSHAKLRRLTAFGERQTLTIPLHRNLDQGTLHAIFRQAIRYVLEADLRPWFFTDDH
jgi:predicted RNA binding protein YcfA (HicA-like mRNA interferase family)